MYSLTRRSFPLNAIFAIFAGYLWRPQGLMVKQDTLAISCLSAISSKRSEEQLSQLMPNGQISWSMRMVQVQVFSWASENTGKVSPSRSLRVSIGSTWDSKSTMTRRDLSDCVWKIILPTCLWKHFLNWKVLHVY